jgi:hypothetical protein
LSGNISCDAPFLFEAFQPKSFFVFRTSGFFASGPPGHFDEFNKNPTAYNSAQIAIGLNPESLYCVVFFRYSVYLHRKKQASR